MDANPSGDVDGFVLLHPITSHSVIPHFISLVFKCRVDSVADFEGKGKPFVMS